MRPGPRIGFAWDRETIVYALELWHRRHLQTPTKAEWVAAGENHPSVDTVMRIFGSWNAAIRAAGFRPRKRGESRGRRPRRWHDQAIVDAIQFWHDTHGRVPTKSDWGRATTSHPSPNTVVRVFGSWNAAIRSAGLALRPRGGAPDPAGCESLPENRPLISVRQVA